MKLASALIASCAMLLASATPSGMASKSRTNAR
eukprot:CAMPEP_0114519124 /NCGR_PEP_ID=MMETSP0109-20121206/18828_1 /TAXON_ID=29199 /ORGANISM="Chlorarachnion reptans, Strain CCCM449" /LENGTH=32 /DNA_ID= /DNA_START= /DNA_END= /DNA_ORIENTATION=